MLLINPSNSAVMVFFVTPMPRGRFPTACFVSGMIFREISEANWP